MPRYRPKGPESPRFAGVRTFMRLPYVLSLEGVDFAVAGVPFDGGTSFRGGARFGPQAIRAISSRLYPYNPAQQIDIFEYLSGVDVGDFDVIPGYIDESYRIITTGMARIVEAGVVPVVLGGDHGVSLPELRALAAKYGPLALVHFDAHTDTEPEHFGLSHGHGTPFYHAAKEDLVDPGRSIQVGIRGALFSVQDAEQSQGLGYEVIRMDEIRQMGIPALMKRIHERVGDAPAFLTFDIDFVDPAYAPGTGTPEIGGPASFEVQEMVRGLAGIRFVGFDVVEVSPPYDESETTALLAANVAYEFISLLALAKKAGGSDALS